MSMCARLLGLRFLKVLHLYKVSSRERILSCFFRLLHKQKIFASSVAQGAFLSSVGGNVHVSHGLDRKLLLSSLYSPITRRDFWTSKVIHDVNYIDNCRTLKCCRWCFRD